MFGWNWSLAYQYFKYSKKQSCTESAQVCVWYIGTDKCEQECWTHEVCESVGGGGIIKKHYGGKVHDQAHHVGHKTHVL